MNIKDATFAVIDTETTGLDPETAKLVEIAAVAVSVTAGIEGMWATLVNPGIPIPPEVSAVHYLTDEDVAKAPDLMRAEVALDRFAEAHQVRATVAHNAAFDAGFFGVGAEAWICTKRLAQHMWPDAPTYKNQGLRFWRGLKVDTFGILPHRALGDAIVTAHILLDILRSPEFSVRGCETVDDLLAFSNAPIRVTKWPLGKHRGKPLEADLGYVRWALGPTGIADMDRDLRHSLNQVLWAAAGVGR